jgi:predicted enzyme related to lactoylglutathione lyase
MMRCPSTLGKNRELDRTPRQRKDVDMERVLGLGGVFLRSNNPEALTAWYRDNLGVGTDPATPWQQQAGPTIFASFDVDTDYFGARSQQVMLNFRVMNLDAMLEQLRAGGAEVDPHVEAMDGVGLFGWVADPDGNRIELWQPSEPLP